MSEAIKGLGDRVHASFAYAIGGDAKEGSSQNYHGVSMRVGPDLVDGQLILTPFVGFHWSAVKAEREETVQGRFVPDETRFESLEEPSSRSVVVEKTTGRVERFSPRGGIAVGWWTPEGGREWAGMGYQAVFEIGPEALMSYGLERSYPEGTTEVTSAGWDAVGLRAGFETLIFPPFPIGDAKSKKAVGLLIGGYYSRTFNPVVRESDNGVELNVGLAVTW